jgi:hypothetical protein
MIRVLRRISANRDRITTYLGLLSAIALAFAGNDFYPQTTSTISAVALALMGFFTNKPTPIDKGRL